MRPVTRACAASAGGKSPSTLKRSTLLDAALSSVLVWSSATMRPDLSMAMRPHKASASSR